MTEEEFQEHPIINWDGIIWVNRPLYLWIVQVILAMISFTEAILLAYLGYKVSVLTNVLESFKTDQGRPSDVTGLHRLVSCWVAVVQGYFELQRRLQWWESEEHVYPKQRALLSK